MVAKNLTDWMGRRKGNAGVAKLKLLRVNNTRTYPYGEHGGKAGPPCPDEQYSLIEHGVDNYNPFLL